jgi:S-(hydroxymethyl)glutathione dehydrogenase/alcohol dehydrogenase
MTKGGVDYSFECLGSVKTAEQSFQMLRRSGTATILGMIPQGAKFELLGQDFLSARKIIGATMGSNHFRVDIPKLASLYRQDRLKLDHLIAGEIGLDAINDGFAAMKTNALARQLIAFH